MAKVKDLKLNEEFSISGATINDGTASGSTVFSSSKVEDLLSTKANSVHNHNSDYYTKTETNSLVVNKADQSLAIAMAVAL